MARIKIKPLSVNRVWQGRRFKTAEYKAYEQELSYKLPPMNVTEGKLCLDICFGFSNKASDVDNCVKPFIDILQQKYGFNDKQIYVMYLEKVDVKKGSEFIRFDIYKLKV